MNMLPNKIVVVKGKGIGKTRLNAFDNALLDAGIGDFNLVRVSSIVPAGCEVVIADKMIEPPLIKEGTLVFVVYSEVRGKEQEQLSACIGLGIPIDDTKNGVIFESSGKEPFSRIKQEAEMMVREAMAKRGNEIKILHTCGDTLYIEQGQNYGAVIVAALMLNVN